MAGSLRYLRVGRKHAKVILCVFVIFLLGLASTWGEGGPFSVSAEIATATQYVAVTVPFSGESNLVIHLDQFGSGEMQGVAVPDGYTGVGNLQIFAGQERKEMTDFSKSPMRIILGNRYGQHGKIKTFGILVKPMGDRDGKWIFWENGRNDDLEKLGFKGKLYTGDPATIVVEKWPEGDPCFCR